MMQLTTSHLITAMVTPFDDQQRVDFDRLAVLIDYLLDHHTEGLLVGGTTGEGPTLTTDEQLALFERTAQLVAGQVPVIANTGSNNTAATIELTRQASQIVGIDAALVVVPPYNKPDQSGMLAHFTAIADRGGLPVLIYNIPGRTGVNMTVATILQLAQHPNIVGIKQCGTDEDLAAIIENTPQDFLVYTGEDAQTLVTRVLGGQGVISVASHVFGNEMFAMDQALMTGDRSTAAHLQRQLMPKMAAFFAAPSPAPIKAALNARHILVGSPRLPILPLTATQRAELFSKIN